MDPGYHDHTLRTLNSRRHRIRDPDEGEHRLRRRGHETHAPAQPHSARRDDRPRESPADANCLPSTRPRRRLGRREGAGDRSPHQPSHVRPHDDLGDLSRPLEDRTVLQAARAGPESEDLHRNYGERPSDSNLGRPAGQSGFRMASVSLPCGVIAVCSRHPPADEPICVSRLDPVAQEPLRYPSAPPRARAVRPPSPRPGRLARTGATASPGKRGPSRSSGRFPVSFHIQFRAGLGTSVTASVKYTGALMG